MFILSMCRICLVEDNNMHSIVNTSLAEMYEKLTATPLETKYGRPLHVCYICHARLQNCYRLQSMCVQSEELLTRMLEGDHADFKTTLKHRNTLKKHPLLNLSLLPTTNDHHDDVKMELTDVFVDCEVKTEHVEDVQDDELTEHLSKVESDDRGQHCADTKQTVNKDELQQSIIINKEQVHVLSHRTINNITSSSIANTQKLTVTNEDIQNTIERTTRNLKQHVCDICNKCFIKKAHLIEHRRVHTGERPYKCDICDKLFIQKGNLTAHVRVHSGEQRFKCDICDKYFGYKSHLIRHNRVHTGEKPFKCDICEKCFPHKSHLLRHNRRHTCQDAL